MTGGESESCSAKGTRLFCSTTWLSCKMDWKSTIYIHLLHLSSTIFGPSLEFCCLHERKAETPAAFLQQSGERFHVISFLQHNRSRQKSTGQMVVLYAQITRTSSPQPLENLVDMQIASQLCNAETKSIESISKAKSLKL